MKSEGIKNCGRLKLKGLATGILILGFYAAAIGQDTFTITGKIRDQQTSLPIEYASIIIRGTSIGVVSNSQGEFELHVPQMFSGDSLFVSMLGYATYKKVAKAVKQDEIILLSQKSILLNEVLINTKELTVEEILNKALKNILINYSSNPYMMEGFFRQIQRVDGKYVSVLEAAVDILDPGYGSGKSEKMGIKEIRRSHYVKTKPYLNIADTFFTQKNNSLINTVSFNNVRALAGTKVRDQSFFNGKFDYTLDSTLSFDNKPVYVISGNQKTNKGYLKDPIKETRINTIVIDAETFGILKIVFDYKPKGSYDPKDFKNVTRTNDSIVSIVTGHHHVYEFANYNGLLYLKYVRWSDFVLDYNVRQKRISHTNEYRHELLINHVLTDPSNFSAITEMKPSQSLHAQAGKYNPEFWKTFNVIYESQQERRLVEELIRKSGIKN